jgi:hypothetical protein
MLLEEDVAMAVEPVPSGSPKTDPLSLRGLPRRRLDPPPTATEADEEPFILLPPETCWPRVFPGL